jgi:hypothetical protein
MTKIAIVLFLLSVSFNISFGQWYVKRYQVNDINFLTKTQLEESLATSKKDLLTTGGIAGFGGILIVVFKYFKPGMSDDPSFIEQLLGDKGVNDIGIGLGIGMLVGGTIASIVYIGRIGSIRSAINRNYPSYGFFKVSPAIILNSDTRSSFPGFRLTYNF